MNYVTWKESAERTAKKYKLTDETIVANGVILHRIMALRDFDDVKKDDKGGYIQNENNLSHEGDAKVSSNAWVFDNAKVFGDAKVSGNAWVKK